MQAYDVFMITVLMAAIAWGAWKGLAWQIASIASIGLSYFVAVNFRGPVAKLFHYDPPEWNNFLAMLVLYLGTSLDRFGWRSTSSATSSRRCNSRSSIARWADSSAERKGC